MYQYAILANPSHTRIYFDEAIKIACLELEAIVSAHDIKIENIGEGNIDLPNCITFKTDKRLDDIDFKAISTSSVYYAMFEIVEDGLLKPVKIDDFRSFPESLVQILKYTGKTNELFTRMMVTLAEAACKTGSKKLRLLDPMCGKGTTLFEGLIRGYDVTGIDINEKWSNEIQTFIVRYLKMGKYKHKTSKEKRTGNNGKKIANYFNLTTAKTKEEFAKGEVQSLDLFTTDTRNAYLLIKKNTCDMLVSDLPYGVQHGSKVANEIAMDRSPLDLLKESIPSWKNALKVKGSLVLSYNEFTLKYDDVKEVLELRGFEVLDRKPYFGYIHRVDQSINRNLIVAIKK